jgi:hypothetical protein
MDIVKSDTITFHGGKNGQKVSCSANLDKIFSHIGHINCDTRAIKNMVFVIVGEGWRCWIFVVPNVFP